jgi:hypothetical protein
MPLSMMKANRECRKSGHAHATITTIPLDPLGSPTVPQRASEGTIGIPMASNVDQASVESYDVDQARNNTAYLRPHADTQASNKSGSSSPGIDTDNEDAPLLSPTSQDYGSANGAGNGNNASAWNEDEFRSLPWWKRPSVGACLLDKQSNWLILTDILAATAIPALRRSIRWHHCAQDQPHHGPCMRRVLCH